MKSKKTMILLSFLPILNMPIAHFLYLRKWGWCDDVLAKRIIIIFLAVIPYGIIAREFPGEWKDTKLFMFILQYIFSTFWSLMVTNAYFKKRD